MPFCFHVGSIWHPNWLHFGIIFRFSVWAYFRCVFFENCSISDPANPQFWCSRLRAVRFFEFSSNRKQIQNERKNPPKWLPKSTNKPVKIKTQINEKSHQIFHRFLPPKWSQNEPKMKGKKVGKFGFGHLWRPRGAPKEPQRHQRSPRAPKMEPKAAPDPQNRPQEEPTDPKMVPRRPPELPK